MPMRVNGLNSGLDTESIVTAMVSSHKMKAEKLTKAQTKLSWTQEAWKGLNSKVYGLYTNLSNLRFSSAYSTKKASVSDATKASVKATGNAVNGTQKLKINTTAQSAYMTGGKLALADPLSEEGLSTKTTLKELGYTGGNTAFSLRVNGESKEIKLTENSTITDVLAAFKEAGVNANFDAKQGRLYLNAKESGKAGDFTIEPTANITNATTGEAVQYNTDSFRALYALGLADAGAASKVYSAVASSDVKMTGGLSGSELAIHFEQPASAADAKAQNELVSALYGSGENDSGARNTTYKVEVNADANGDPVASYQLDGYVFKDGKIYTADDTTFSNAIASYEEKGTPGLYQGDDSIYAMGGSKASYASRGTASSDITVDTMNTGSSLLFHFEEPKSAQEAALQNALNVSIHHNGDLEIVTGAADANGVVSATYTMPSFVLRDGKVYSKDDTSFTNPIASYEERGTLIADQIDRKSSLTVTGGSTATYIDESDAGRAPTKIDGRDAEIELNGVTYTNSSNNFSINGLEIEALAETDGEITVSTSTDTQAIYDKIKDFLTEYNSLINEMTKLYNADSSRGYEPLTDEEREAMSDSEIEKWEAKIKDSLLRRDSTLDSVMSTMINSMNASYEINGTKYSLTSFGISTLGYLNAAKNENYAYHIDGDADDENTSGKKDKLMEAIAENPDDLIEFMKKLTGEMYTKLGDKMKGTALRSAYTIYNDKEMTSQYTEYGKQIAAWEKKLSEKEDYYYNKFSKMEAAMAKLQSQTNSLTGLFGGGQ